MRGLTELTWLGALVVSLGVWILIRAIRFARTAVRAQGVVESCVLTTRRTGEHDRQQYETHIQYTDRSGRVHRFCTTGKYPFGGLVEVLYHPEKPSEGCVKYDLWGCPLCVMGIGAFHILLGCFS